MNLCLCLIENCMIQCKKVSKIRFILVSFVNCHQHIISQFQRTNEALGETYFTDCNERVLENIQHFVFNNQNPVNKYWLCTSQLWKHWMFFENEMEILNFSVSWTRRNSPPPKKERDAKYFVTPFIGTHHFCSLCLRVSSEWHDASKTRTVLTNGTTGLSLNFTCTTMTRHYWTHCTTLTRHYVTHSTSGHVLQLSRVLTFLNNC